MEAVVDTNSGHEARYETRTFDPRGAFAWTLRSAEIARRQRNRHITRRSETPTFDPRGAFAWTLRSGEIARRERQRELSAVEDLVGAC